MNQTIYLACLSLLLLSHATGIAGQFTPNDLYTFEVVKFENGLEAILNPRGTSKYVSLRIIVGVGQNSFPCEDEELPHFAEHLIYSGTSQYDESLLEGFIENWGGSWNASTRGDTTVYELDIYSANIYDAIELHHQMFTDSVLTEETVDTAREVIHAESGGKPGMVRKFLHRNGIIINAIGHAYQQFVQGTRAFCSILPSAEHIDRLAILQFLDNYYVPSNMTVIAVGDFDRGKMLSTLEHTFGSIENSRSFSKTMEVPELEAHRLEYHTTLSPFVADESYVSLGFQVPRDFSAEKMALVLLGRYVEAELYRELRIERGWAYTPEVTIENHLDFSVLYMDAEVPVNRTKETFDVFKAVVEKVRTTGVPADDFDMFKNGILLSQARAYESNYEFADFYADFIDYYWKNAAYPDWEHTIQSVDLAMTKNVAKRYFLLDRAMYYYEEPTLSYAGLGVLAFVILILPISAVIAWRTRSRASYNRSAVRLHLSPNSNNPTVTSKHSQS